MPRPLIIPTILTKDAETAHRRLALIEPAVRVVQIDVMDGTLVPQSSWHDASAVASWPFDILYELHLMVADPIFTLESWGRVRGLTRAIIHAETPNKLGHLIKSARRHVREVGLAISPGTPVSVILPYLKRVDAVQVMGGKPGKGGQSLDRRTLQTVREIRRLSPEMPIGFDIGVSHKTIPQLFDAGVNRFCAGYAIFGARSPMRAIIEMQGLLDRLYERE